MDSAPEGTTEILSKIDLTSPVIFLGVADGERTENPASSLEALSLFSLARVKPHFAFPVIAKKAAWCFLVNSQNLQSGKNLQIRLLDPQGNQRGSFGIGGLPLEAGSTDSLEPATQDTRTKQQAPVKTTIVLDEQQWVLQASLNEGLVIQEPGEYRLLADCGNRVFFLGRLIYVFAPPPPLSDEQISALESDPASRSQVIFKFGCKHCNSTLSTYIAVRNSDELAKKGHLFYLDLPDRFTCSCGKTDMNLDYLRRGGHGFLGRGARISVGDISYVQRYAHSQLLEIASNFLALVDKEKKEEAVQQFLEENKVLFARFHAQRLFVKPRILGKFNADFAILDSEGVLTLIEIERPALRLFKKNGHLRSGFNQAYEQVQDWLDEVSKHRFAVIEGLGLEHDHVLSIRGCVIAGRAKVERREHLRRHMSQPRANIEFFTLDMLGKSLISMAEELP